MLGGLLTEYNFHLHVASDIGIDELYLPSSNFNTQLHLNTIQHWTSDNLMKLNNQKCNYMIFSRSNTEFATRLHVNNNIIDRIEEQKILGLWLSSYLDYERNTREICSKAYCRISMLTKLKYVGTSQEDLLTIYVLFIRCLVEYCSVVWHSSLTVEQENDIERTQVVSLKVILGHRYTDYTTALLDTKLEKHSIRIEKKCLLFGLQCLKHPKLKQMFPLRKHSEHNLRNKDK